MYFGYEISPFYMMMSHAWIGMALLIYKVCYVQSKSYARLHSCPALLVLLKQQPINGLFQSRKDAADSEKSKEKCEREDMMECGPFRVRANTDSKNGVSVALHLRILINQLQVLNAGEIAFQNGTNTWGVNLGIWT